MITVNKMKNKNVWCLVCVSETNLIMATWPLDLDTIICSLCSRVWNSELGNMLLSEKAVTV